MTLKTVLTIALAVLHLSPAVQGAPNAALERRGVCDSGIYGELAPILAGYSIAQAYCTQVYPLKCSAKAQKRAASTTTTTTKAATTTGKVTTATTRSTTTTTKSTTRSTTTTTVDSKSSAWSKCQAQPGNVVSTLCSCIQKVCIYLKLNPFPHESL